MNDTSNAELHKYSDEERQRMIDHMKRPRPGDNTELDAQLRGKVVDFFKNHSAAFTHTSIDNLMSIFQAEIAQREQAAVKLVEKKFRKLEHGIFAIKPFLDKPYPDDPRWTPYTRFIQPREIMVRQALKGNDVGELWAMGEMQRQATKPEKDLTA